MKVIWKYDVIDGEIEMPFGSKILKLDVQENIPRMWVCVNPDAISEKRKFVIIGTGQKFDDTDLKYVGTFEHGPFVWHVFEIVK